MVKVELAKVDDSKRRPMIGVSDVDDEKEEREENGHKPP